MRRSLFGRVMATQAALLVVIFLTLWVASSYLLEHYFFRAKERELLANADELIDGIVRASEIGGAERVESLLATFATFTGAAAWIIDEAGRPQVGAPAGLQRGGRPRVALGEAELAQLTQGRRVTLERHGAPFRQKMLSLALPLSTAANDWFAVVFDAPLYGVNSTVASIRRLLLYVALASFAVALSGGYIMSQRLAAPLHQLVQGVGRLAAGEFQIRLAGRSTEEIDRLTNAFNHMAERLEWTVRRLEQESRRMSAVLSGIRDGVVFVNASGVLEMSNESAAAVLRPEAEPGRTPIGRAVRAQELADWFKTALGGRSVVGELKDVNGQTYAVRVWPVTGEREQTWGAVGVLRDITEQRAFERMRREFVANIAHELRTPLTSVRGFLEAVIDGVARNPAEAEEYLRIALEETDRVHRLAQSLMDLSSIEQGKVRLQLEPVGLRRAAVRVLEKLSPQIDAKGISVRVEAPDDLPPAKADPDKLHQVLMNLLDNAVRFSPDGGEVLVRAQPLAGSAPGEAYVEVQVEDQGPGIPAQEHERVWERFYKVDPARRSHGLSGGGLGLTIAKELVEAHGGRVGVRNRPGRGSTFWFVLPAETPVSPGP